MSIYTIKLQGNSNTSSSATFQAFLGSTFLFFTVAYLASILF